MPYPETLPSQDSFLCEVYSGLKNPEYPEHKKAELKQNFRRYFNDPTMDTQNRPFMLGIGTKEHEFLEHVPEVLEFFSDVGQKFFDTYRFLEIYNLAPDSASNEKVMEMVMFLKKYSLFIGQIVDELDADNQIPEDLKLNILNKYKISIKDHLITGAFNILLWKGFKKYQDDFNNQNINQGILNHHVDIILKSILEFLKINNFNPEIGRDILTRIFEVTPNIEKFHKFVDDLLRGLNVDTLFANRILDDNYEIYPYIKQTYENSDTKVKDRFPVLSRLAFNEKFPQDYLLRVKNVMSELYLIYLINDIFTYEDKKALEYSQNHYIIIFLDDFKNYSFTNPTLKSIQSDLINFYRKTKPSLQNCNVYNPKEYQSFLYNFTKKTLALRKQLIADGFNSWFRTHENTTELIERMRKINSYNEWMDELVIKFSTEFETYRSPIFERKNASGNLSFFTKAKDNDWRRFFILLRSIQDEFNPILEQANIHDKNVLQTFLVNRFISAVQSHQAQELTDAPQLKAKKFFIEACFALINQNPRPQTINIDTVIEQGLRRSEDIRRELSKYFVGKNTITNLKDVLRELCSEQKNYSLMSTLGLLIQGKSIYKEIFWEILLIAYLKNIIDKSEKVEDQIFGANAQSQSLTLPDFIDRLGQHKFKDELIESRIKKIISGIKDSKSNSSQETLNAINNIQMETNERLIDSTQIR